METTQTNTYSWIGGTVTLILFIIGIALIVKHHKAAGFWFGMLAMFLLSSYVVIEKTSTEIGAGPFRLSATDNKC